MLLKSTACLLYILHRHLFTIGKPGQGYSTTLQSGLHNIIKCAAAAALYLQRGGGARFTIISSLSTSLTIQQFVIAVMVPTGSRQE